MYNYAYEKIIKKPLLFKKNILIRNIRFNVQMPHSRETQFKSRLPKHTYTCYRKEALSEFLWRLLNTEQGSCLISGRIVNILFFFPLHCSPSPRFFSFVNKIKRSHCRHAAWGICRTPIVIDTTRMTCVHTIFSGISPISTCILWHSWHTLFPALSHAIKFSISGVFNVAARVGRVKSDSGGPPSLPLSVFRSMCIVYNLIKSMPLSFGDGT